MSMREEFESAYAADMKQRGRPVTTVAFWRNADDTYALPIVERAWWAWQASRQALEIKLPETEWFGDSYKGDWALSPEEVSEALREAGVRVKP